MNNDAYHRLTELETRLADLERAIEILQSGLLEGSPAWRAGIEASLRKVNYRLNIMPDLMVPAYRQALLDVKLHLDAMLERNTECSGTPVDDTDPDMDDPDMDDEASLVYMEAAKGLLEKASISVSTGANELKELSALLKEGI